jgi:hypothetical protein
MIDYLLAGIITLRVIKSMHRVKISQSARGSDQWRVRGSESWQGAVRVGRVLDEVTTRDAKRCERGDASAALAVQHGRASD